MIRTEIGANFKSHGNSMKNIREGSQARLPAIAFAFLAGCAPYRFSLIYTYPSGVIPHWLLCCLCASGYFTDVRLVA